MSVWLPGGSMNGFNNGGSQGNEIYGNDRRNDYSSGNFGGNNMGNSRYGDFGMDQGMMNSMPGGMNSMGIPGYHTQNMEPNFPHQSRQDEIASKIISAVSNMMGNRGNQSGPPFDMNEMDNFDRRGRRNAQAFSPPPLRRSQGAFSPPPLRNSRRERNRFSRERRSRTPPRRRRETSFERRPGASRGRVVKRPRISPTRSRGREMEFKRNKRFSRERRVSQGPRERSRSKTSGSEGKPKIKKDLEPTPIEALFCHMCKLGNFSSESTYLFHLEGTRHTKAATAFHEKSEAQLMYLRHNAKLANVRFGSFVRSVKPWMCRFCMNVVREPPNKHRNHLEHKTVTRYVRPICCGKEYQTRYQMDNHLLSLPHLRDTFKKKQRQKLLMESFTKSEMPDTNFDAIMEKLKSENKVMDEDEMEITEPYDGESIVGLEYLSTRDAVLCTPCQTLVPIGMKSLECHMVSIDHYSNVIDRLREEGRQEMIKRSKPAEKDEAGFEEVGEDLAPNKRSSKDGGEDSSEDEAEDIMLSQDNSVGEEGDSPALDNAEENDHENQNQTPEPEPKPEDQENYYNPESILEDGDNEEQKEPEITIVNEDMD